MKTTIAVLFTAFSLQSAAQEIAGKILNEKREPVENSKVQVFQKGILKGASQSDMDGNYVIKPLDPGIYDVLFSYSGYDSVLVTNAEVTPDYRTAQNITLPDHASPAGKVVIAYKKPIPLNEVTDLVANPPIDYQAHRGQAQEFFGPSISTIQYVIDEPAQLPVLPIINTTFDAVPKADLDNPSSYMMTSEEIAHMPLREINDLLTFFPGVYQQQRGRGVSIYGSHTDGTLYIVDGMQIMRR